MPKDIIKYLSIGLIVLGFVVRFQELGNGSGALFYGLIGLSIAFILEIGKRIYDKDNWKILNFSIILLLMSLVLFSKYLFYNFGDYIGLVIIPLFIIYSIYYLLKIKNKEVSTIIVSIVFLVLTIPLFGYKYYESPVQYIPRTWHINRMSDTENINYDTGFKYQYPETKEMHIEANKLSENNKIDDAINLYKEAQIKEPNNPFIYLGISGVYAHKNELEKAIKYLDTAIEINNNVLTFFNNRGLYYYKLNKDEKALENYNKSIEIDPTFCGSYANIALINYFSGEFEKACMNLTKAENLGFELENMKNIDELKRLKRKHCQ